METRIQPAEIAAPARLWPPCTRPEKLTYAAIIGSALICLLLLAWVHLGLGALLFPPAATAQQQVAHAGDYSITLNLGSGQLTADGANAVTLTVRDTAGHPLTNANVRVQPVMTTMQMNVPAVTATTQSAGLYAAHPAFGMAGIWRLDITITPSNAQPTTTSFNVSVRWN